MNKNKNLVLAIALLAAIAFSSCKSYVAPYDGPTTSAIEAKKEIDKKS